MAFGARDTIDYGKMRLLRTIQFNLTKGVPLVLRSNVQFNYLIVQ